MGGSKLLLRSGWNAWKGRFGIRKIDGLNRKLIDKWR